MRYFYLLIQLLAALYLAKYASDYVMRGNYLYIGILFAGVIIFFLSSWKQKFLFFSLMIFFPIILPRYFPLPTKTVVELMAPILCLVSIAEAVNMRQSLFSKKASIYFIAIGVLVLWVLIHYILNPVLGRLTFGSDIQSSGLKSYFLVVAGISTFFCSYWFVKCNELNTEKWLSFLLVLTLVAGNLYVVGLFTYIPILSHLGLGSYHTTGEGLQYSSIPVRVMHALGTCLILSLFHNRRWGFYFIIIFINTLVFMVMGGGRSSGPIAFAAIFAYITLINRKHIVPVMSVLLILSSLYTLYMSNLDVPMSESRFGRVLKLEGGLAEQDEARYYTFLYMFEVFKKSPIIGKGIGYEDITGQEDFFKENPEAAKNILYIKAQLMSGGHGTYMSILSVFGIGGFFWLMVMLWGSIYYAYRFINMNKASPSQDTIIAIFVFLLLITISVSFLVGGHGGYDNMKFWFLAGTVAGLISRDRPKDVIDLSGS